MGAQRGLAGVESMVPSLPRLAGGWWLPGDRSSPMARAGQRRGSGSPAQLLNASLHVHGPDQVSVPQFTLLPPSLGLAFIQGWHLCHCFAPSESKGGGAASSLGILSHCTRPPFSGCLRLLIWVVFLCEYAGLKAGQNPGSRGNISNLLVLWITNAKVRASSGWAFPAPP